jgi:group I intron endonuclease
MLIYLVTNKLNDKQYVGKTVAPLGQRKKGHYLSTKNGSETNFHRALRKYDEECFEWKPLIECESKDDLNKKEIFYIEKYNTHKQGYNMTIGGEGGLTYNLYTDNYHHIKEKLGKWKNGNPGSTSEAIQKRRKTMVKGVGKVDSSLETNQNVVVQPNRQRVRVYGVDFDSYTEASKVYGVTIRTVKNRCNNELYTEWRKI